MDTNNKEFIDIEDALKRVGGNEGLYKRLLGRFVDGDHLGPLENALQSGDFEESAHLAHTLKGVSANLSLIKVTTLSAELEQAIKNGNDYSLLLSNLKQAYGTTLEKISEISG